MGSINRHKEYDDPYRVLAARLIAIFPIVTLKRILSNDALVRSMIILETKQMDICGMFLDCIDQEVISNDRIRKKNSFLKQLGDFYFSELDLGRLRKEIRQFAEELGVSLEE